MNINRIAYVVVIDFIPMPLATYVKTGRLRLWAITC